MQTFLPYRDFVLSAQVLDSKRLGKQRVEAWQIYMTLIKRSRGWRHHPAVKMWRGYEVALLHYGFVCCLEWRRREYVDNLGVKFKRAMDRRIARGEEYVIPPWITPAFIRAHRSNLVRKFPAYYRMHFPDVPNTLPYMWPEAT